MSKIEIQIRVCESCRDMILNDPVASHQPGWFDDMVNAQVRVINPDLSLAYLTNECNWCTRLVRSMATAMVTADGYVWEID